MPRKIQFPSFGRQVLESLPSGILVIDVTSRVLYINREGARVVEEKPAQFVGTMLVSLPRFRPLITSINHYRRRTPALTASRQQFEGAFVRTDGRVVPLGFSISNLVNSRRRVLGYVLIFRDLSDVQRLRERARHTDMLAALGSMAAGVAHEIRNPLHTIRAALDVLEMKLARKEDPQEYLDIVRGEIERADRTVQEILSYSKNNESHFQQTGLADLLKRALSLVSVPETVQVVQDLNESVPSLYLDEERILRVLINLLENAVDALDGKGTLSLRLRLEDRDILTSGSGPVSGCALIEVADDGPGIALADLPHVFEPFFTRKSSRGGTGLGLAICQRIVEEHAGQIDVTSRLGKGATFTIRLPLKRGVFPPA